MKKIWPFMILLMFAASAAAAENPWDRKLPFKSATVKYKVAGSMKGEKTLYVKDYGRTSAEYSTVTMKVFGMSQDQKEIIITTPDWVYSADLIEKTGTKQTNMNKFMKEEYNKLSSSDQKKLVKNSEAMGISTIEDLNGTVEKNAVNILGYDCDKVTVMGTTAYNISGSALPLKIQGDTMGIKIFQEAVNLSTGSVLSSKFNLPPGIEFEYDPVADQMMKEQAQEMVKNLVEGKSPMAGAVPPAQTESYAQPSTPSQPSNDYGVGQDAKDVGQAARQETKDATIDEVKQGVRSVFKSLFD
ncbi:MAG: hypothetical protein HUK40_17535 [Desulfobacter sp.]|nr:hypothetical protein [Desulfobacter sp.]WDP86882.1 MAG: hypothetical protein HUN05_18575 [Desulfobacter sp.]